MCVVRLLLLKDQGAYTESFDISPELMQIYYIDRTILIAN